MEPRTIWSAHLIGALLQFRETGHRVGQVIWKRGDAGRLCRLDWG